MIHWLGCLVGALVMSLPWVIMWRLSSKLISQQPKQEGTTIDDWVLRGGKKE